MPRKVIPFLPDQYYHFFNRGNNRQEVFFERENYLYFMRVLRKYLLPFVDIPVYCLMPTHYHIVARIKPGLDPGVPVSQKISRAMQKLGISYTKAINKRFNRVGALFQGQFHGKLIQKYQHLLTLCVYIHANPVKDGLVDSPEEWEYSNYPEWVGLQTGTLFNREFIQEYYGTPEEYKGLVMDYIRTRKIPDDSRKYLLELED